MKKIAIAIVMMIIAFSAFAKASNKISNRKMKELNKELTKLEKEAVECREEFDKENAKFVNWNSDTSVKEAWGVGLNSLQELIVAYDNCIVALKSYASSKNFNTVEYCGLIKEWKIAYSKYRSDWDKLLEAYNEYKKKPIQ